MNYNTWFVTAFSCAFGLLCILTSVESRTSLSKSNTFLTYTRLPMLGSSLLERQESKKLMKGKILRKSGKRERKRKRKEEKKAKREERRAEMSKNEEKNKKSEKQFSTELSNVKKQVSTNTKRVNKNTKRVNKNTKRVKENTGRLDALHSQSKEVINMLRISSKLAKMTQLSVDASKTKADEVQAAANGQIAKLRRMWASEDVRIKYNKERAKRESDDQKSNIHDCEREKTEDNGMLVFPATPLEDETDHNACINKNRDRLVQAFCNFRTDNFDMILRRHGLKNGRHYWPNICCKSQDGNGDTDCGYNGLFREQIVPFAGAQGGKTTFEALYSEVKDVLQYRGYLHVGMMNILKDIGNERRTSEFNSTLHDLFGESTLCGPKRFRLPGSGKEEVHMCQLFYPYKHLLHLFQTKFLEIVHPKSDEATDFLQLMELRQGPIKTADKPPSMLNVLQNKEPPKNHKSSCPRVSGSNAEELDDYKDQFCNYYHLDLAQPDDFNIAMVYLEDDFDTKAISTMEAVALNVKFDVKDECKSPMFTEEDISIQEVNIDGKESREWVGIVKLDTTTKDGYLQNELGKCRKLGYLPRTEITVGVLRPVTKQKYCDCVSDNDESGEENTKEKTKGAKRKGAKKMSRAMLFRHFREIDKKVGKDMRKKRDLKEHLSEKSVLLEISTRKCIDGKKRCGTEHVFEPLKHDYTGKPCEYSVEVTGSLYELKRGHLERTAKNAKRKSKARRRALLQGAGAASAS